METMTITPALGNIQKTLLLPLWGRAQASRMKEPVLIDHRAVELIERMDYDFSPLFKKLGVFHALSLAVRAKEFDAVLVDFIRRKGSATIVNLGAGLDTAFSRVPDANVRWVDIDMPDVIALRKQMIPETSGMKEIPKSMFDASIIDDIGKADNVLLMVGGVFMYFEETRVKQFFRQLADRFHGAEILFDVLTPLGIRYYNRKLADSGFRGAVMKWGIRDPHQMESWNPALKIMNRFSFYSHVRIQPEWPLEVRLKMRLADLLEFADIVHMKVI